MGWAELGRENGRHYKDVSGEIADWLRERRPSLAVKLDIEADEIENEEEWDWRLSSLSIACLLSKLPTLTISETLTAHHRRPSSSSTDAASALCVRNSTVQSSLFKTEQSSSSSIHPSSSRRHRRRNAVAAKPTIREARRRREEERRHCEEERRRREEKPPSPGTPPPRRTTGNRVEDMIWWNDVMSGKQKTNKAKRGIKHGAKSAEILEDNRRLSAS
nr:hypothetical protein Iba_chr11aCG13330 [Ipomoea batatas]